MREPEFDFAISYAGSDRVVAERIASLLVAGGASVFIDRSYRAQLIGSRLDRRFETMFGPGTRYFVPIISRAYADRTWPQYEWSIALREAVDREDDFILPLRLDDTLLPGSPHTVCYVDLRETPVEEAAALLLQKLAGMPKSDVCWVATFGVSVDNLMESGELPTTAPTDYADLCDWLTMDLLARLDGSLGSNVRFMEDSRNGETLSVRVAFERYGEDIRIEPAELGWWELLEVLPYREEYKGELAP